MRHRRMYFEGQGDYSSIGTMSDSSILKPTVVHYGRWRNRFLCAGVALAFAVLLWFKGEPGFPRWIGIVLLGVVGGLCLLPSETRFDPAKRVIERRWKLLGVLTVFRRWLPLAQFRQVCWRAVGSWDENSSHNSYAWKVGLARIFHSRIEQRSGGGVTRLEMIEPNETAIHRFFGDRL